MGDNQGIAGEFQGNDSKDIAKTFRACLPKNIRSTQEGWKYHDFGRKISSQNRENLYGVQLSVF